MSGKRRKTILALAAAGVVGLGAPIAAAHSVDNDVTSGLVNVHDNQVQGQACNNNVPVNAVGGQVPVDDVLGALGIGADGNTVATDNSCHQDAHQSND